MSHTAPFLTVLGILAVLALVALGAFAPLAFAVGDLAHAVVQDWARQAAALVVPV